MSGVQLLIPFYLEYSLGLNPLFSGLVMASYPIVYFMTSLFAGPASDRIYPPTLVFAGIALGGVASLAFSIFLKLDMILITICFMMILGVCFGLFFSPGNKYMMSIPKPENLGAASGAISTVGLIGASVGLVVFETVFSLSMPPHDSFLHGKSSVEGFSRSLDGAFTNALVAGTILCIISAAFAAYLIIRKRAGNT